MNQLHPERRVGGVCPECGTKLIHAKDDEDFVFCPLPGCGWDQRYAKGGRMDMAEVEINDFMGAPIADHNMPCPICQDQKAVLRLGKGRFDPCWDCQKKGWSVMRSPLVSWINSLLDKFLYQ